MRTYSFDLATAQLALLMTITRQDEVVIRATTWPQPITLPGTSLTWTPQPGFKAGDVSESNNGTPASWSFTISTVDGGDFDFVDISNDKFYAAKVQVDIIDAAHPELGANFHFMGEVGQVDTTTLDQAAFDVRSEFSYPRNIFIPVFTLMCKTDFGSLTGCRIPVMRKEVDRNEPGISIGDGRRFRFGSSGTPEDYAGVYLEAIAGGVTGPTTPSFSSTIGATMVDGSVTWETKDAWEKPAQIASVIDPHNFTLDRDPDPRAVENSDYYIPGRLQMRSGYSLNKSARIGTYDASIRQVTTFMPLGLVIDVGDWLLIWPDCDKTMTMCSDKYNNAINYQGFPYQVGAKAAAQMGLGL